MSAELRVGIVGCGLIGRKRAEALGDDKLVCLYDKEPSAAEGLAKEFSGEVVESLEAVCERDLDVVLVATPHSDLAAAAIAALEAGSHVLVEKPAGISLAEVELIAAAAERANRLVKVGFNHRFSPGIHQAVTTATSLAYGDVMFVRARYGHGGRLGYEKEWRMRPEVSGGGELVDQGMHLIDLFHWILGPLPLHSALLRTQYWQAPVEDNAVLVLGDREPADGPWAIAHATWTEWKNMFSLEIYCRTAKLQVDGLAGSYGPQRLTVYEMRPELGPPDTEVFEFSAEDTSWVREWENVRGALTGRDSAMLGTLEDARYAWTTVEKAYELNERSA